MTLSPACTKAVTSRTCRLSVTTTCTPWHDSLYTSSCSSGPSPEHCPANCPAQCPAHCPADCPAQCRVLTINSRAEPSRAEVRHDCVSVGDVFSQVLHVDQSRQHDWQQQCHVTAAARHSLDLTYRQTDRQTVYSVINVDYQLVQWLANNHAH